MIANSLGMCPIRVVRVNSSSITLVGVLKFNLHVVEVTRVWRHPMGVLATRDGSFF